MAKCGRPVHKDVEFAVDVRGHEQVFKDQQVFKTFEEAASVAVQEAIFEDEPVNLDVLVHSKAGAKAYGGDDAVEQYEEDPEASVFERFVIRANSQGRVP